MSTPTRIKVTWNTSEGRYVSSEPTWDGGEVVLASEYDSLQAENTRLREALRDLLAWANIIPESRFYYLRENAELALAAGKGERDAT